MNKKPLILLLVLVIIYLIYILLINSSLNNSIKNTIKYNNINYNTDINLSINDKNNKSSIKYEIRRSNGVININYIQSINNKNLNKLSKYYITSENKKYEYLLDNGKYIKKEIDEIDYTFKIDYESILKTLKSIKYKGTEKIKGKEFLVYTAKTKAYNAYNYLYSNEILSKKDNNDNVLLNIYVDKENNFIYKISYKIKNLNSGVDEDTNANYSVEIINFDINSTKVIKLPTKK